MHQICHIPDVFHCIRKHMRRGGLAVRWDPRTGRLRSPRLLHSNTCRICKAIKSALCSARQRVEWKYESSRKWKVWLENNLKKEILRGDRVAFRPQPSARYHSGRMSVCTQVGTEEQFTVYYLYSDLQTLFKWIKGKRRMLAVAWLRHHVRVVMLWERRALRSPSKSCDLLKFKTWQIR